MSVLPNRIAVIFLAVLGAFILIGQAIGQESPVAAPEPPSPPEPAPAVSKPAPSVSASAPVTKLAFKPGSNSKQGSATNGSATNGKQDNAPMSSDPKRALEEKIAALIQQLGDDDFTVREKAQQELERLGLAAFDALYRAQKHSDVEIALRANYLVRSMRVNWAENQASPQVKRILRNYDDLDDEERKNRMDRLAELDVLDGLPAICRLVRFEASLPLAKRGVLLVMNHELPEDPEDTDQKSLKKARLAALIREAAGDSEREAVRWLRTYADTLETPDATLEQWQYLIAKEHQKFNQTPKETGRDIVRDLYRWQADLLAQRQKQEEAFAVMKKSLDLVEDDREQLVDAADWLIEKKAFDLLNELSKRFSATFDKSPLLLYRLAEAQTKAGQMEQGQKTAQKALALNPQNTSSHLEAAYALQERGLLDWAESEYRLVLEHEKESVGSRVDLYARLLLSEMLHDQLKELEAAKVLQTAVDAFDKDPAALKNLSGFNRDPGGVRSRMHYFYSLHFAEQGEREKQMEHLREGVKHDPNDADVLIAMYRLEDVDEAWKTEARQHIEKSVNHFRNEIKKYEEAAARAAPDGGDDAANRLLASANNQLAWLISNTTGDYDEALRCSLKSLELRPNTAGYLDTLGRCYYAKGDFENAVKNQSKAVELEPHSEQIRRQLELFQKALAEDKKQ